CFSGDATFVRECAARGYWTSFAGNVTYPKNEHLRAAAAAVPLDRLLVETDSPFLAPQKLRGRANAPQNVLFTLGTLAEVRPTRAPGRRSRDRDAARRDRALARMAQERDARRGRDAAVGADDLIERRRSPAIRGRTAVARVAGATSAGHRLGGRHDRHGESAAGDAGGRV